MMNPFPLMLAAALLATTTVAAAQGAPAPPVGVLAAPCSVRPSPPPGEAAFVEARARALDAGQPLPRRSPESAAAYDQYQRALLAQDFPNLCRYEQANAELAPATSHRIVFLGDSITEAWMARRPAFFAGDRIDRGISGQTTIQMLGRFYADVIALRPATVHILAGTNDIAGNTGPTSIARIQNNIRMMVELAKVHRIGVVLGTVPPAFAYSWRPTIDPKPSIAELNNWIRAYAKSERLTLVDYFAMLDDGRGGLSPADSEDGVHPTPAGYAKMEAALLKAFPLR